MHGSREEPSAGARIRGASRPEILVLKKGTIKNTDLHLNLRIIFQFGCFLDDGLEGEDHVDVHGHPLRPLLMAKLDQLA